jgi:hypothetical protein
MVFFARSTDVASVDLRLRMAFLLQVLAYFLIWGLRELEILTVRNLQSLDPIPRMRVAFLLTRHLCFVPSTDMLRIARLLFFL